MSSPCDAAATEAYERLRHLLRSGSPGGARFGLAVLLREGVAAWIDRCAAVPDLAASSVVDHVVREPLTAAPQIRDGVVQILATIALRMTAGGAHAHH